MKKLPWGQEGNCGGASPPWVNPDLYGQLTKKQPSAHAKLIGSLCAPLRLPCTGFFKFDPG